MVPNHARYHLRYTPMRFFIIMITHTVVKYLFSFFAEKYAKFVGSCFRKKCIFLLFFS